MPDRSMSRVLAFSVDRGAIDQLVAIFREAGAQIEERVRDDCEREYQDRLGELEERHAVIPNGTSNDPFEEGRRNNLEGSWRKEDVKFFVGKRKS
jgi:hypothetical protein